MGIDHLKEDIDRKIALLRMALGDDTFNYMVRSLKQDLRIFNARMVDIVVRKDAVERRIEADWVKSIARIVKDVEVPPL